jgi:dipeptidyl aminopeptidase/acylaminoacyl peptidase
MRVAVEQLTKMGIVESSKVGITGLSHGAEMVDYGISHTDLFHAAISNGGGARDPTFFYLGIKLWREIFADWGLDGWPEGQSSSKWHRLSPLLNANRIEAPLLENVADKEYHRTGRTGQTG